MKWKFEPADFGTEYGDLSMFDASDIANAKLDEWRKQATVVYGHQESPLHPITWCSFKKNDDTHRALLIDIEELSKEPCEHEPVVDIGGIMAKCRHCGVKLKAKWEPCREDNLTPIEDLYD